MVELIEGRIYVCADKELRRLDKIEDGFLYYSVPMDFKKGNYTWMKLSKTERWLIEDDFINGTFWKNPEEADHKHKYKLIEFDGDAITLKCETCNTVTTYSGLKLVSVEEKFADNPEIKVGQYTTVNLGAMTNEDIES